jgi:hypothetical protein
VKPWAALPACALVLLASSAAAQSRFSVVELQLPEGTSPERCVAVLEDAFRAGNLRPEDDDARAAILQACAGGKRDVTLVLPRRPSFEPTVTLSVTGTWQRGNVNSGNIGGTAGYRRSFTVHALEGTLKGQALLDSQGRLQHLVDLFVTDDVPLSAHWTLFGLVTTGRDTRKNLAFYVGETTGFAFNVFDRKSPVQVKLSLGAGHRYEVPLDGSTTVRNNRDGFAGNNALLSWRVKGRWASPDAAVQLSALAGFQHILYAPPRTGAAARVLDVADYRLYSEATVKFRLASLGPGRELFGNVTATYDYFANPVAPLPWDLGLLGGLGLSF